jgi:hypothetical protein
MAGAIRWDGWQELQRELRKKAGSYGNGGERCAGQVAEQVINDAIHKRPTVPIDTGTLRGSGTFEIPPHGLRSVKLIAGFNTAYAAHVHQVPMNFREPSAGNYYLSDKLRRYRQSYIRGWARCVARELGMA